MEYTTLGSTDLEISRIGLGLWNIVDDINWDKTDKDQAIRTIHTAVDSGINFFDTAEAYGDGYSEEVLGDALQSIDRDDVVVATKAADGNLGYHDLKKACEGSLERLGIDTIDVYYLHYANHDIPLEETARALNELQSEGKIRHCAVSNFGVLDLDEILKQVTIQANQLPYNLLWRAIEYEVAPKCRAEDVDIISYSSLAQGLLTGKYSSANDVPPGQARSRLFSGDRPRARHGEDGCEEEVFAAIEEISELCEAHNVEMTEASISWLLNQQGVASVLVGASRPEHVQANALATEIELSDRFISELNSITDEIMTHIGTNPDVWQSESRYR